MGRGFASLLLQRLLQADHHQRAVGTRGQHPGVGRRQHEQGGERLTQVAKRWFGHVGAIGPYSVRRDAAAECEQAATVTKP